MIYPIVVYGHPVLKKKAEDIKQGELDVKQLAEDMYETMHHASGIGLAAPQIGKGIRMFVVDGSATEDEEIENFKQVFINPEILEEDGEPFIMEEGCLSIPNIRAEVERESRIKIRFFDENWKEHEEEYTGMRARVVQHEYDHIEGILFTDHLSSIKKRLLKSKLTAMSKGKAKADYAIVFADGKRG
ncbi:MAG: peptide deformylase [Cyclobacteriaceae bacterium]|nr:peptide deformylase [Cyclobacteriaceae bacterium]MCH8516902.1 peptide deformylase [Cyclobacteriaceae bacterium]